MDRKTISARVKQARLEAGLKQRHIAKRLGIPISAVSLLENGNRGLDVVELLLLADLFSKQPEWFYLDNVIPDKRRWSDKEEDIFVAMNLFRAAPTSIQLCVAKSMITFFKSYKHRVELVGKSKLKN